MNEEFESIIEKCQSYLENKPTLVIGSGFSVPYGLPTMWGLGTEIKNKLNPIYSNHDDWKRFLEILEKTGDLELTLHKAELSNEIYKNIIKTTWQYINKKDEEVFLQIASSSKRVELVTILNKLLQSHPREVNIITANYDRLVEYSSDAAGANIHCGFTGEYIKKFSLPSQESGSFLKRVNLCKVHGSLDWFKREDSTIISIPNSREILGDLTPVIVTPGVQKYQETHLDPYRTLITQADKFINEAPSFLCIGYGFNDEHLQPKLIDQIQRFNKPIVIVTKSLSERGRSILEASKKYIVFEESDEGKTKVTHDSGSLIIEGEYWDLKNFNDIWLG